MSIIIPTHNEAQAIERVLADLPSDLTTEIIVVDRQFHGWDARDRRENGSTRRCSWTVLRDRNAICNALRIAGHCSKLRALAQFAFRLEDPLVLVIFRSSLRQIIRDNPYTAFRGHSQRRRCEHRSQVLGLEQFLPEP